MKSLLIFLLVPFFMTQSSTVEVIKFPALQKEMATSNGKIKVINFWATWCKPCVEELPHFEQLHRNFTNQVDVVLVSVDQVSQVESKVNPALERNRISSKVVLLDEVNSNSWIDKVDPSWSGAIPTTLIIDQNGKHHLYEKGLSYPELVKIIHELHPNN